MKSLINKLRSIPKGVKASIAFFIASIVSTGMSYITTPIFTRLLSSDEYGQVSVFMTWMSVFGIIAMFCLSAGVFNNGMIDFKEDRAGYSFSMLTLSNIITIGFGIVLTLLYPLIKKIINIDIPLLIIMFLVFLTRPAYSFFIARKRYEYEYKPALISSIIVAIVSPVASVICVLTTSGSRLYARIIGAELALVVIYIFFYIYIVKKANFKVKTEYWKYAFKFNLPLIPHYLSVFLLGSVNKIMISHMVSDAATAYYSVANSIASLASIAWGAINASLIPFTYEKCKKKDYESISKVTMPILTLIAGLSIIVIMLAPEVVAFMATSEYTEAIYVIPPIVAGVFLQVQYFIYANIVYYHKKPKYVMYASITALVVNITLNFIFIKKFGYMAAGYVTLIAYLVQACIDYLAMKKVVKEKVYNMKIIALLTGLVIVVALLSNLIYGIAIVRYSVLVLMFIVAVIFRKKIFNVLTIMRKKG